MIYPENCTDNDKAELIRESLKREIDDIQCGEELTPLKAAIDEIGYEGATVAMLWLLQCHAEVERGTEGDSDMIVNLGPFKLTIRDGKVTESKKLCACDVDVSYDETAMWEGYC